MPPVPAVIDGLAEDVARSVLVREMVDDGLARLDADGPTPVVRLVQPEPAPVVDLAERRGAGPAIY